MSREYVLQPFRAPVELQIDYAAELNAQQHAAVTAPPGPALVIAGAGSGKTRTLTYRVAFLLEHGVAPERLLLLTFTNKAAREMMRRVTDLLGQELNALWGGTFHSIGNRILRRQAASVGYTPGFTILDRADCKDLISASVAQAKIDATATRFPKADVLGDIFSLALNTRQTVAQLVESQYEYFSSLATEIDTVRKIYEERKRASNSMDFDDLLVLWLRLLEQDAEAREYYQRRFQFVLVDEYQDTNRIQSDLIDLLAAKHQNLMVVGDDAQSIYAWRGAHYQNILKFTERYPKAVIYKVETNYRSTPEILQVANAAIAANTGQYAKELSPVRKPGNKPVLAVCGDANEQAVFVAQRVLELREEGVALDQMAVLYRSHFHALELQLELTRRNIPFSITSGIRFFEQAHIKDVTAGLKLAANPHDELSFKRLVQLLPGVGGKSAEKIWQAYQAGVGKETVSLPAGLQAAGGSVPKKTAKAWEQFAAMLQQVAEALPAGDISGMISIICEGGYEDHLKETYPNYRVRLEDINQLAAFATQFQSLEDFLAQMALLTNLEAEEEPAAKKDDERLRLSTVHQSKGLEFAVVFVIMLCDGLFPSARSIEDGDLEAEEEERRLFYVAVTRAKDELYLSYPLIRATAGGGDYMQQPSRFLSEIPPELLDEWSLRTGY